MMLLWLLRLLLRLLVAVWWAEDAQHLQLCPAACDSQHMLTILLLLLLLR